MAKRTPPNRKKPEQPKYHCSDCRHSYDWHSEAIDGHLILCRCPLDEGTKHGKWCKFLKDPQCENFILRDNGTQ